MSAPLVNEVTEGSVRNGCPYITITSHGQPNLTKAQLSDGRSLGLVQSIDWHIDLGTFASCSIETIASPAELKVWLQDTTINVRPAPGYGPFRYLWDWSCAWIYNLFTRPTRTKSE